MSEHLSICRLVTVSSLDTLQGDWNRLAGNVPFRSWEWCTTWWRHYATGGASLMVLVVQAPDGAVIGIAPWYVEINVLQGRVIRFLGSGEVCSDYTTVLAAAGCEAAVARTIAGWLDDQGAAEWDVLELDGVAAGDLSCEHLAAAMDEASHQVARRSSLNTWRIALPESWDEFVAGLSKSTRAKVRKLERRTAERLTTHLARTDDDFVRGFRILVDLHQRRRESLGEPGCFASLSFTAFHAQMMHQLFQRDELRLRWIELDQRPIAVEYSLVVDRTSYYYQGGFDPAAADENPGWLQFMVSIRAAIESGCRCYDFLRGDEPYKAQWNARPTPIEEIRAVGNRASAHLRNSMRETMLAARTVARRSWQHAQSMGRAIFRNRAAELNGESSTPARAPQLAPQEAE